MEKKQIFEKLKNILTTEINVKIDITEETALVGDKILDSLDFMNYITCIEQEYNIKISDEDILMHKLGVIKNMVEYINQKNK